MRKYTSLESSQLNASLPVSSLTEISRKMTQATAANEIAKVELTQDLRSSQTFTVPAGIVLEIDLRGKILDVPLNVLGELILRYGELNQPFTGTGIVKCWGVEFTASSVATGNISNCEFISCVFPATLTSGNVTNCIISGSRGDSDSVLAIGAMFDCDVDLKGGVNSLDPTDSAIVISGDWTNLSNVGTGSNIIARNKNLSALVTSDGYSVLGRSGATSGTAQSLTAHVDGYVLMRRSGAVGFDQLTTADIPGLSTAITATKYVTTEHKTSNYTVTYADNGKTFTNKGATSLVIFTLPAAAMSGNDGYQFNFYCDGYTGLRVQATSTNNIVVGDISTDDDGYYQTYTPTQYVELFCYDNQTWYDKSNSQLFTNEVQNSNFRQSAGLSVVGRSANTTGDVADITAASDGYVLRRSGTTIGFGEVAQSAVSGLTSTLSALSASKISTIGSSTDNAVTRWDGTGGTAIQNSTVTISDTGEISGARKTVTIYTTNANLTSAQSDSIISNKGATALVTYTLPTPSSGLRYEFFVDGYTGITVATNTSGVYIEVDGYLSVNSFTSYTTGDKIILWAQDANGWHGTQSGSNHGDHGDITVQQTDTGDWYFIDNNVVSYNKIQQMSGLSVLGRATNSTGNTAEITAGTDGYFLGRSGTSLAFLPLPPSVTDHTLLSNIGTNTHAQIDSHIAASSGVHGISGSVVGTTDNQTLTNKTVEDGTFNIIDNVINSKVARFSAGNISNSTTRVFDFPDASGTLALTSDIIPPTDIVNSQIAIGADIALTKLDTVTANMALVSDNDGYISAHSTVSATELGYLDGATSNIQTQINTKASISSLDGYVLKATSSTDNALVRWDGTSGRLIQNSGIIIADDNTMIGQHIKISDKPTAYTVTTAESGTKYTNRGATAEVEFTLPNLTPALTSAQQLIFTFHVIESVGIKITCGNAENWIVGLDQTSSALGGSIQLTAVDDCITLVSENDGYQWSCVSAVGKSEILANSVLGRAGNTAGIAAPIQATSTDTYLKFNGTNLVWSAIPGGITDHTALTSIGTNTHSDIDVHIAASSGVHGITGSFVGTTDNQSLSNKTISALDNTITNIGNSSILGGSLAYNKLAQLTPDMAAMSGPDGYLTTHASVTSTELGYLDGVTSAIQTQLNNKIGTSLTSANIIVGNGSNVAAAVAMSGDVTIDNAGATTIGNDKVTFAKMQNSAAGISVIGKSDTGSGDFAEIVATADGQYLTRSGGAIVWSTPGFGSGNVTNAGASTDNAIVRFDGTGGTTIQNSGVTLDDNNLMAFNNDGYISVPTGGKRLVIKTGSTEAFQFRLSAFESTASGTNGSPRIQYISNAATTPIFGVDGTTASTGINLSAASTLGIVAGNTHIFDVNTTSLVGKKPTAKSHNSTILAEANNGDVMFGVESNTGIGPGPAGDMLSIINGGSETVIFDTTNLQTVSAGSDIKAKITYGVDYTQQSPVIYGFNTTNATGLSCYSGDNTLSLHANAKAIFTLDGGTYPSLYGLDPSAVSADQPKIRSFGGDTSSRPIYSFASSDNWGLSLSGSGVALINNGTDIINCLSDGLYESANSMDTSTSTSSLTVDAAAANIWRWKADFTTSQTISIDNLTTGRYVEIWVKNLNGSSEPALTVQASSTTSGHTTVPMAVGNGLANATSGLSLPAGTWCLFRVRSVGTDFVGYML